MKLMIILSIIFIQQVHAGVNTQTITISYEKVSLKTIFKEINRQTGYEFVYNSQMLEKALPVSVKLDKATLNEALEICFKGQPFSYAIEGKTIVVTPKVKGQNVTVSGRVTDKKGDPLFGAYILIKGTLKGTTTDLNGYFSFDVPENAVLIFRFIGYQTKEIPVFGKAVINVVMEEEAAELQEVAFISTGYQKIKPEQSTGSLTTIKAREFNTRVNTTDFLIGLQNKVPGLLINNDIQFEGNSLFQIRGISTINGNRNPLIVVDGYPTELSLDMIDPNEIESVTVLKDAAAATVYGVRASNGVIVVERKKAEVGKVKVNFRTTLSFTPKENYDRYRWDKDASNIAIDYEKVRNGNISSGLWDLIKTGQEQTNYTSPAIILAQQAAGIISEEQANQKLVTLGSYNNAKDYSRLFLRRAAEQTYNLDMSGGNERVLYYLTANYINNEASQIKKNNSQFRLSGRSTLRLSDRLSLDLSTDFQEVKASSVPIPDINEIYPYERFQDENGNPLPLYSGSNVNTYYNQYIKSLGLLDNLYYPLIDINEISDKTYTVNNRITSNFLFDIGKGFKLNFGGVYEYSRTDTKHLASESSSEAHQYINYYTKITNGAFTYGIPKGAFLKQQTSSTEGYTIRAQLNYDKQITDNHSLNLILGGEIRDILTKSNLASYFGYNDQTLFSQAVDYQSIANFSPTYAYNNSSVSYNNLFSQGYTDDRYVSMYSNMVYAYKGKYSLTGSIRIDQSNLFGTDPKYKYKPLWSVGAAWNIHKEKFMQSLSIVKSLKLRMAYGFNGNVAKNTLPQVIASDGLSYINPSSATPMLTLSSYANSSLRWEQTNNFNIGVDYEIFKGITGNIDYYIKKSTDILAKTQTDATKGGTSELVNQASIRNNGLEVSLHADWITRRNFNWNTGLIFSRNTNKVLQVYNINLTSSSESSSYVNGSYSSYLKGYSVGTLFSYRYAGLDNTGYPLIYDKNGNVKPLYSNDEGKADVICSGSSIPAFNLGLSNRVDIKNFYIYCMINYYAKFALRVPIPDPTAVRPLEGAGNYWKQVGDEANQDILPPITQGYYYYILAPTDKYTVNGSYLTLGDLTAAYSLRNANIVKKVGITDLEIKIQASNVFTVGFNKYNYSVATGSYAKSYLTPTYTIALSVNF